MGSANFYFPWLNFTVARILIISWFPLSNSLCVTNTCSGNIICSFILSFCVHKETDAIDWSVVLRSAVQQHYLKWVDKLTLTLMSLFHQAPAGRMYRCFFQRRRRSLSRRQRATDKRWWRRGNEEERHLFWCTAVVFVELLLIVPVEEGESLKKK